MIKWMYATKQFHLHGAKSEHINRKIIPVCCVTVSFPPAESDISEAEIKYTPNMGSQKQQQYWSVQ